MREKTDLFAKATKFEQIMMHFVSQYNRLESLSRSLRIAFENQLYLNTSVNKLASQNSIPVQQALAIVGDKVGFAEQQRAMHLFESLQSQLLTFEQFHALVRESYREKDLAVLEAAFNELDKEN